MSVIILLQCRESAEEWVWDTFETTPPMSPYLVACVLSELEYLETSYQSISGRIVTLRLWTESRNFNLLDLSYDILPKIMMTLENYLAIPYALPKLDIIAFPGYSVTRAMENWGLIIQRFVQPTLFKYPVDIAFGFPNEPYTV